MYHKEIEQSVIIIETDGNEEQRHKESQLQKESLEDNEQSECHTKENSKSSNFCENNIKEIRQTVTEDSLIKRKTNNQNEIMLKLTLNQLPNSNKKEDTKIKYVLIFIFVLIIIIMTIIVCFLLL